ncbi:hypothetical protein Agub_g8314 [Astrephomene gubernaculifera]|uniref:Glycoside hydrolase family 42 N-terminal domain-containing protein n=1 Tax=Astrephomene gubernaculifera TaxID=47775 RepID=A0AAD3DRG0_9CHLO|nr:hypothetical protein Agub_g8314 [Astrephomene gubernaculifera]
MGLFESSRDRSKRAREVYQICLFGTALGAILLLLVFLWNDAAFASSRKQSMPGSDAPNFPKPRVVRRGKAKNTFGTIYHNELMSYYGLNSARPETFAKLLGTLQDMEQANINTVLFSINWDFFEPEEDKPNWDYLNALVGTACNYTVLEVSLAFDMLHAPSWLLQKYPDSFSMDAEGRNYTTQLSWYHPAANARGLDMLHLMATHLASNFSDCVFSMQPVYNNEDEAKFTQEYDAFQDYSPPALAAFRAWLRTRRPDLADINSRWGSEWGGWEEVRPPAVLAGNSVGVETSARWVLGGGGEEERRGGGEVKWTRDWDGQWVASILSYPSTRPLTTHFTTWPPGIGTR